MEKSDQNVLVQINLPGEREYAEAMQKANALRVELIKLLQIIYPEQDDERKVALENLGLCMVGKGEPSHPHHFDMIREWELTEADVLGSNVFNLIIKNKENGNSANTLTSADSYVLRCISSFLEQIYNKDFKQLQKRLGSTVLSIDGFSNAEHLDEETRNFLVEDVRETKHAPILAEISKHIAGFFEKISDRASQIREKELLEKKDEISEKIDYMERSIQKITENLRENYPNDWQDRWLEMRLRFLGSLKETDQTLSQFAAYHLLIDNNSPTASHRLEEDKLDLPGQLISKFLQQCLQRLDDGKAETESIKKNLIPECDEKLNRIERTMEESRKTLKGLIGRKISFHGTIPEIVSGVRGFTSTFKTVSQDLSSTLTDPSLTDWTDNLMDIDERQRPMLKSFHEFKKDILINLQEALSAREALIAGIREKYPHDFEHVLKITIGNLNNQLSQAGEKGKTYGAYNVITGRIDLTSRPLNSQSGRDTQLLAMPFDLPDDEIMKFFESVLSELSNK